MPADPKVLERLGKIEAELRTLKARIVALEARAGEKQLAKLTDNPPTIEGQYAITQILKIAGDLAFAGLHSSDPATASLCGEISSWLDAMGMGRDWSQAPR